MGIAVIHGNIACCRELVSFGADVNKAMDSGSTPLHLAAKYGRTEIFSLLLKKGADVSRKNKNDQNALEMATDRIALEMATDSIAELVKEITTRGGNNFQKKKKKTKTFHPYSFYFYIEIACDEQNRISSLKE